MILVLKWFYDKNVLSTPKLSIRAVQCSDDTTVELYILHQGRSMLTWFVSLNTTTNFDFGNELPVTFFKFHFIKFCFCAQKYTQREDEGVGDITPTLRIQYFVKIWLNHNINKICHIFLSDKLKKGIP